MFGPRALDCLIRASSFLSGRFAHRVYVSAKMTLDGIPVRLNKIELQNYWPWRLRPELRLTIFSEQSIFGLVFRATYRLGQYITN